MTTNHSSLRVLSCAAALLAITPVLAPSVKAQEAFKTPKSGALSKVRYLGFEAYRMSNGRTEAIIVPALGRVMRYGMVGGANLLWNGKPGPTKPGDWANWGGDKSWPAPQSRWPIAIDRNWPPHPSWDGDAYKSTVVDSKTLRITSGVWPVFGVRVIRDFRFELNGDFAITQTCEKVSGPKTEIAIWNITQVSTPQAIFLPANPQSPYKNGFYFLTKPKNPVGISSVRPDLLKVTPNGGDLFKIGVDSPISSLVVLKDGIAFRQSANRQLGQYPDGADGSGFPLEIFDIGGKGAGHYMETELLSPLRIFNVGSRWQQTVKWRLQPLKNKNIDSPELFAEVRSIMQRP